MNLPQIHQAALDEETFFSLLSDIEQFGTDVEATAKRDPRRLVVGGPMSLASARELLATRAILACQFRYLFDGQRWCDTVTRTPDGFSLVRISLSDALAHAN